MSTTTDCLAVVTSSGGWNLTGAATHTAAVSDHLDTSYAWYTVGGTISPAYVVGFDFSGIPQSALIQSVTLDPYTGIAVDTVGDAGTCLYVLSNVNGPAQGDTFSNTWAGSSNLSPNPRRPATMLTADAAGPWTRSGLDSLALTIQGQASGGDVQLYVFMVRLSVVWSARSGGVL